jgi:hypothetical protein
MKSWSRGEILDELSNAILKTTILKNEQGQSLELLGEWFRRHPEFECQWGEMLPAVPEKKGDEVEGDQPTAEVLHQVCLFIQFC